jgi:hypothetical protein
MIDQTTASQLERYSPLRLPPQAAPIDRSQSPASAVASDGGVEAAAWWNDVLDVVKTVGGVAGPLIAGLSDRTLKRDITPVEWSH